MTTFLSKWFGRERLQPIVICRGWVREAGGGTVELLVDRDTDTYPTKGTYVALVVDQ